MPAMRPHPVNAQSVPCRPRRCDSEGISDNERTAVAQRKQHPEKIFQKFENKVIEQTDSMPTLSRKSSQKPFHAVSSVWKMRNAGVVLDGETRRWA
jgi:ribosome-associated toxin RatA of RatAB toxin-antitoxin module